MKNAVITILCILVLCLGGFIIYDKVINKEEKKDNNVVEETKEEQSLNKKTSFSNKLSLVDFRVTLEKTYDELKDIKLSDLSDKDLMYLAIPKGNEIELTEEDNKSGYVYHIQIQESDYSNSIKDTFGKTIDFEKTIGDGLEIGIEEYKYNKDTKTIERYIKAGGFEVYNHSTEKIEIEGNMLYLYANATIEQISEKSNYKLKFTYILDGDKYIFSRLQILE